MILQGINEIVGGIKDKRDGKRNLAEVEKEREALTPKISSIAQEDLLNPYDKGMINMMQQNQAQRQANAMGAAGRNPLAATRISSQQSQEGLQSDLAMLKFMDQKRSGARETFRKEEVGVMDKKWADFLGRRGEAKDLIQQGKQRASQGLGSIDEAIATVVTMGMSQIGGPSAGPTPPVTNNPGQAPQVSGGTQNVDVEVDWSGEYGNSPDQNYGYNPGYGGQ